MTKSLTQAPGGAPNTLLNFPLVTDLERLDADIAILGIPFGMPYRPSAMANDQSRAPDALRHTTSSSDVAYTRNHFDWDLGGPLLDGRDITVVDCGNVTADMGDHQEHYRRAEQAARLIFSANTTLITLGGDHGIPIPVMRALEVHGGPITLVHVDAHLDWRHEINGITEGPSSTMRRASEMPWINRLIQVGMRGVGSARQAEVAAAQAYGAKILTAKDVHEGGIERVLDLVPNGAACLVTIDCDGLDPSIMPAVNAPVPGGLLYRLVIDLIHNLAEKVDVHGFNLVEFVPEKDINGLGALTAARIVFNMIGALARSESL